MAISKYTADREKQKFKESTAVAGQVAVVVVNPDGSSVGGGVYNATPPTYTDGDTVQAQYDVNGNQKVSLATTLDKTQDSVTAFTKGATYTKLSASGVVATSSVALLGYYVEASSTGVISLYDNATAASGNTMLALSKAVTANDYVMLPVPVIVTAGVYFSLVSGTATVYILTRELGV